MPASSTSTLSLASRLRDLGNAELAELLTLREVRDVRLRDFFDLADALLEPALIEKALSRLDRMTLAVLGAVGELATDTDGPSSARVATRVAALVPAEATVDASLHIARDLALLDGGANGWIPYAPVTEVLAAWPRRGLPGLDELLTEASPPSLAPVSASDSRFIDHVAAEHAFNSTNAVAELVAEIQREPARELARGGIALPESKRLSAAMSIHLDAVPALVDIASRAGLVALDAGIWLPTAAAAEWMLRPSGERWAHLAGAWFARLPADIQGLLAERAHATWGERLAEYVRWLYPAGGLWMRERALAYSRDAELLGVTANQVPSTPGAALLASGEDDAAAAMGPLFPPEIDRVYVQHDLSIVSPGPLLPRLDARLRMLADVESRALATTYRVSQSSVNRALARGETAESMRSLLSEISLTGIPQPLEYLIAGTAARFGSIRVGRIDEPTGAANEQGARTYITSEDATLLASVLVDHGLAPLGFTRVGPYRAVSRFDQDVVFWSLNEARYPAAAEDAQHRIILLERRRVARTVAAPTESTADAIVRKLRIGGESTSAETGQAWLERQIDAAIRGKIALTVTVAMPDGSSIDLQLEPASLAGGRLRARDRRSDLERTLPLRSITAVAPAAAE
ncbi:MAG: hypothetical protein QOF79_188 [Actinomycetota bacterium]|nr:hypothetical protein [Actinomycetota bacterium]